MRQVSLRNNPLLAALLGTVVTGLGHFYLRRWLRALGWLGLIVAASVLFVPESTITALSSGTLTDPFSILPIILISAASALDAYLIAKVRRQPDRFQANTTVGSTGADESPACPACGKPVDPDLGFCHWCTTEFNVVDVTKLEQIDENQSN
ncbi:zinc ribbon domain-containing protein [Halorubrum ezzemoulense]|uniref:zinc ribbon domain-containing protein n=1 Tax=Halorubrum ezzemoulense TaxID=337243 RepID=UPI00232A7BF6|nr:zinc ribbon domain-containing protein [Halorubrum ezzemoulense]MDB2225804.1 zinc ribbon domain-containing protein [Halorubrum ezzemoulense]